MARIRRFYKFFIFPLPQSGGCWASRGSPILTGRFNKSTAYFEPIGIIDLTDLPTEESLSIEGPVVNEDAPAIARDAAISERPEIETESGAPVDNPDKALPIVTSPAAAQQRSENNNGKQTRCKKCGAIIDDVTKKCTGCGKRHFHARTIVPVALLAILLVLSIGLNVTQYLQSREAIETLETQKTEIETLEKRAASLSTTVSTQNSTITSQKNTIASLERRAGFFDIICDELSSGNLGHAAGNFKSSESIIVVGKDETDRKFTLTANWTDGGTVAVDYSGSVAAFVSFDDDTWTTSTKMTVVPRREGVTAVTFSNDVDSKTFKVLIIVTD